MNKKRQPVICMTRCCGWYVPKHAGNPGKQAEYKDRLGFNPSKFSK